MGGGKPALSFGSWKRPHPKGTRAQLIWDKGGHAGGLGDLSIPWKNNHEEIYVLGSGFKGHRGSGVLSGYHVTASERSGRNHPHEKPVSLMEELLCKCPQDWVIIDPFAGSGSTLRAAKNLGRRAIGFEIEEKYCEIIATRLAQECLF